MGLRTLYLQSLSEANGRDSLLGRQLYQEFRRVSDDSLLGHMVVDDDVYENFQEKRFKSDLVPLKHVRSLAPNVIYLEGGLFGGNAGRWRIPSELARELVEAGAVMIVADVDLNETRRYMRYYNEAFDFFGTFARSCFDNTHDEPIYGSDQTSCWQGHHQQIVCKPGEMEIDEWLSPVYEGVSEVLAALPVALDYRADILASGNRGTTGTLRLDM